jgi:hypothetical protein
VKRALALCLLLPTPALGTPSAKQLTTWSSTGAQLLPDAYGVEQLRAAQELGLQLPVGDRLQLSGLGLARMTPEGSRPDELDLLRASLGYHHPRVTVRMGRMTRLDSRGLLHLDGLSVDALAGQPLSFSAWGGSLWHPEIQATGEAIAAGGELRLRPRAARTAEAALGYQATQVDAAVEHRLHARGGLFGAKHQRLGTLVELGLPTDEDDLGVRAGLSGRIPVGTQVTLGGDLRWEGLALATTSGAVRTPFDWLAPEDYGIANISASVRGAGWTLWTTGGPTLRTADGAKLGGLGRASLVWDQRRDLQLGTFGSGAAIGGSWVGGGGLELGWRGDHARLDSSAGAYALQTLAGDAGVAWEARMSAEAFLDESPAREGLAHYLGLRLELAAGTDTLLAPWYRAGLVLDARLGRADWGRP